MTRCDHEVVVAGGGIAGAAAALALAQRGTTVSVVEPHLPAELQSTDPIGLRVSALSLGSRNLLDRLGVWSAIAGPRVTEYVAMQVWDDAAELRFEAGDIRSEALGYIVENLAVQQALWSRLRQLENVELRSPAAVQGIDCEDRMSRVSLDDGTTIRCRLVVGADGARSSIRSLAGLKHSVRDYDQKAIVGVVETTQPHEHTAWQRFTNSGPVALLPLPEPRQVSIVWSTANEEADALLAMDDAQFADSLTRITESRLGALKPISQRGAFPLKRLDASRYIAPGLVLLGDAAHVVHPLAGQGANLGLQDVAALVDVVDEARGSDAYIGSLAVLRRYERWRRSENTLVSLSMDALHHLFTTQRAPLPLLRQTGLRLINRTRLAKRLFARQASGMVRQPAKLLRPDEETFL